MTATNTTQDTNAQQTQHTVPTLDLTPLLQPPTTNPKNTPSQKLSTAQQLVELCSQNGCIALSSHSVPPEFINDAFALNHSLFDLPYDSKMKAPHPNGLVPHRGYSGPGREKVSALEALKGGSSRGVASVKDVADLKETYEVGSESYAEHYNIWLPADVLPGFKESALGIYWRFNVLATAIIEGFVMGLGLDGKEAEEVRALVGGHRNQLRFLHYPGLEGMGGFREEVDGGKGVESSNRLGAHCDWSLFTLLFQDSVGGLEFFDSDSGKFMPATPKEGVVYLNVGDMLMRLSNDRMPSSLHRVVAPPAIKDDGKDTISIPDRYSIAYFVAPDNEDMIKTPDSIVEGDGKRVYETMTFRQYSEMRFKAMQVQDKR